MWWREKSFSEKKSGNREQQVSEGKRGKKLDRFKGKWDFPEMDYIHKLRVYLS